MVAPRQEQGRRDSHPIRMLGYGRNLGSVPKKGLSERRMEIGRCRGARETQGQGHREKPGEGTNTKSTEAEGTEGTEKSKERERAGGARRGELERPIQNS